MANAEPHLSLTPPITHSPTSLDPSNLGCVYVNSPCDAKGDAWLLDSGATDHMTFDAKDFTQTSLPRRINITNTNGVISLVTWHRQLILTHTLHRPNTLLVTSLTHQLLSVSQMTSDLNFLVLMYPTFDPSIR